MPVGVSNRHVHLSEEDTRALFGSEASLTRLRDLSQPGQFVAGELVQLAGPSGALTNVRVLGPARPQTQVEISRTDAYRLGVRPPVRDSGQLGGTPGAVLLGPAGSVVLREGVIIAARHLHLPPDDASRLGLRDRQLVDVEIPGPRAGLMHRVLVRVHPRFVLELHLDTDEANAYFVQSGDQVWVQFGGEEAQEQAWPDPAPSRPASVPDPPGLTLVTEAEVVAAARRQAHLVVAAGALVTPLAQDALRQFNVVLESARPSAGGGPA